MSIALCKTGLRAVGPMITDDAATIDGDAGDELLTATAEYHTGPLADDIADDSDLGLLAAPLTPPEGRWTTENPKPKLPAPPKTTLTRYALHTERTFALALCGFYDKSTLYALRWDNANMSHPVDGQRNGKRPGPSAGGLGWCFTSLSTITGTMSSKRRVLPCLTSD